MQKKVKKTDQKFVEGHNKCLKIAQKVRKKYVTKAWQVVEGGGEGGVAAPQACWFFEDYGTYRPDLQVSNTLL